MGGIDTITDLKPPMPTIPSPDISTTVPIIEAPPGVIDSIASKETSDIVTKIEDGLVGEVPPEKIITDLSDKFNVTFKTGD